MQVVGFCEEEQNVNELSIYPIMGPINSAVEVSRKLKGDEIYSIIMPEQHADIYEMMLVADQSCIGSAWCPI